MLDRTRSIRMRPHLVAVSTILALIAIPLSLALYRYVRVRARHYSESFFSAVTELDRAEHKTDASTRRHASRRRHRRGSEQVGQRRNSKANAAGDNPKFSLDPVGVLKRGRCARYIDQRH